jgi:hypothetical protein
MVFNPLLIFNLIKSKLTLYLGIALAVVVFLWKIRHDGEVAGAHKLKHKIDALNDKITTKWDKIDNSSLGVDDAIDRLSKRAAKAGHQRQP